MDKSKKINVSEENNGLIEKKNDRATTSLIIKVADHRCDDEITPAHSSSLAN